MDGLTGDKAAGFIERLFELGHESPVEHVSFTFAIEGVSRSFLAQVTRHRIASFSVQSQRYVEKSDFEYVTPPEIAHSAEAALAFEEAMAEAGRAYERLSDILHAKHTAVLIASGMPEKKASAAARKMANEDARFVLPNACETKMVVTMNARSLFNFFRLRCCNRAQWEIREAAWLMLRECRKAAPTLFAKAGPACVNGPCSEGKMTCGKAAEVRKRALDG